MATKRHKRAGKRAGSYRMCAGCRTRLPRAVSLRCVRGPGGEVVPDLFGKLPGRGVHLCPDLDCFRKAAKKQAFGHGLRARVVPVEPERLCGRFLDSARSQVLAMLATCARAGWLVAGRTPVRHALREGRAALVIVAGDASDALRNEMQALSGNLRLACTQMLHKQDLGRYHHGKSVAVLGVRHRGVAERMAIELARIDRLETSMSRELSKPPIRLTGKSVHGKMPPHRAGSRIDRS